MFALRYRLLLLALAGMVVIDASHSTGRAQGFHPFFRVAPGLNVPQAAYNIATLGKAYSFVPPYAMGYNPYLNTGVNVNPLPLPLVPPGPNPGGNPYVPGYVPPYIPNYSNPYTANPYTSASLTSTTGVPSNGGYDSSSYYTNPYSGSYGDPVGGALRGTADLVNSTSRVRVTYQQAELLKEQVRRERIENQRKIFDEWLYEREKTPTAQDERERAQKLELRRSLNDPPTAEIWSAKALNDLLDHLQKAKPGEIKSTPIAVDEDVVKRVNITSGSGGNVGILKNEGRTLNWPAALKALDFDPERKLLSSLVPETVAQARTGRVDGANIKEMTSALDKMQRQLTSSIRDLPPTQYMDAKRFLNNLEEGVKLLGKEDAANYFNDQYSLRGKTIQDLVKFMTDKGLKFAPAVGGDESAYLALHRALVAYELATGRKIAEK